MKIIKDDFISKLEAVQILQKAYMEGRIQAKDGCASVLDDISAVKAADVQPVDGWISVKDRLPDDCVEVLVYDTDCGIVIGWYNKKESIFVAEFMNELDAVTHWMPLPELPKDSEHE